MLNISAIRGMSLRALAEAAGDEEEKKRKEKEEDEKKKQQEKNQKPDDNPKDTPDENSEDVPTEEQPEENTKDTLGDGPEQKNDDPETPPENEEPTEPEGNDPPADENPEGSTDDVPADDEFGGDEFSMDPDGRESEEDLGPAPDGLPEADATEDDDEASVDDENTEMNIQVNILKLSKLDRALAKKQCFQLFMDLRAKLQATLAIIEKNESVIDPDIRTAAVDKLTSNQVVLDQFLQYKFPIMNYEEALQSYYLMVQDINKVIGEVRNEGIVGRKGKHTNKESS